MGSICSVADPVLRERAQVYGFVETTAAVATQQDIDISGDVVEASSIHATVHSWKVRFPDPVGSDRIYQPGDDESLEPGQYGIVRIQPGARLRLQSGVYKFQELHLESDSHLVVDTSAERVNIYVRDALTHRGTVTDTTLPLFGNQIVIGYAGTSPVFIESGLRATLIAPNSSVTLASLNGLAEHIGSIFAKEIEAHQHTRVRSEPSTRSIQQAQSTDLDSIQIEPFGGALVPLLFGAPEFVPPRLTFLSVRSVGDGPQRRRAA